MSDDSTDTADCPYVLGESYARRDIPTFEFKPSAAGYTGGGYPRVRSTERRDSTPGDGTDDVFVSIHRLAAVVWCYPENKPLAEINREMVGTDVHHTLGMPSANGEDFVETRTHGEHSEITQAQRRAWAEDAKHEPERADDGKGCVACGGDAKATFEGVDEEYCLACATTRADGRTIRIV